VIIQVDPARCTDCRLCEIFCSLRQEGYVNPSLARVHIRRDESRKLLAPIVCPPCEEKKCIAACPEPGALTIAPQAGAVTVVEALCTGCSKCITACDIGAIRLLRQDGRGKNGKAVVLKCNQCDGDPACVRVCEPKALEYVDDCVIVKSGLRDEAIPNSQVGRPQGGFAEFTLSKANVLAMTRGQQVFERLRALLAEMEKDWTQRGGPPRRRIHSR
jgi:anaerobic carbon-monoxide dehydrogenase iron sulfur subunit